MSNLEFWKNRFTGSSQAREMPVKRNERIPEVRISGVPFTVVRTEPFAATRVERNGT